MHPATGSHLSQPVVKMHADPTIFLWHGAGIVLIGEVADGDWSLTRGWLGADVLTDIRRWRFAGAHGFQVQVRRLCREATGHASLADHAFQAAGQWAATAR